MTKKLLATALALTLLLPAGCTSLLDREYVTASYHSTTPEVTGSNDALRVENYQEMVNALLYLVTQREETGTLRLYDYDEERAAADLTAACTEVSQEDALGAYSVSYLQFDLSTIVSYLEADITITYRRTEAQVSSIHTAIGTAAIRTAIGQELSQFSREIVLQLNYYSGDSAALQELVTRAYYENPASALGMPTVEIEFYPRTGTQRIAELTLSYPLGTELLVYRQSKLLDTAETLVASTLLLSDETLILALCDLVMSGDGLAEEGDTAYDALLLDGATSQGLSLALALLCQQRDLSVYVVEGTLNGVPHFWNVVETDDGYRQVDITTYDPDGDNADFFRSDLQADQIGYLWDCDWIPLCGDQPEAYTDTNVALY